MESSLLFIPARSRREAMDWGLVLASQGIEATLTKDERGWGLLVGEQEYDFSRKTIGKWRQENRGWRWRREDEGTDVPFHWGALIWALGMVAMYYWSTARYPGLKSAGAMNTRSFMAGEWWRLFTAVTLHGDLGHLVANISTGIILMGIAMARFGAGAALIAGFLAGAAGNIASILIYPEVHQGLGASGMIMGALGMLATQSFAFWQRFPFAAKLAFRALSAAVLFLVLVGFSPGTDIIAHVGGFIAGAIFGYILSWIPPQQLRSAKISASATLIVLFWLILTWWFAANKSLKL